MSEQIDSSSRICFWFSGLIGGEISAEDCKLSGPPSADCTDENVKKVRITLKKTNEVHEHRRKLRLLVWIMLDITYNVELGYAADLREACASVTHRRAEAVMCLCARNCWMNSETAQNSSRTSQQEEVKPGLLRTTRKNKEHRCNVTVRRSRASLVAV